MSYEIQQEQEKSNQILDILQQGLESLGFERQEILNDDYISYSFDIHKISLKMCCCEDIYGVHIKAISENNPKGLSHSLFLCTIFDSYNYIEILTYFLQNPNISIKFKKLLNEKKYKYKTEEITK